MTKSQALHTKVIVTRPYSQGKLLTQKLKALGVDVVFSPTIVIKKVANEKYIQTKIKKLKAIDLLIFISRNAVKFAMHYVNKYSYDITNIQIASIGQATTNELQKFGLTVDFSPKTKPFNSQRLLDLKRLQSIKGEAIFIVRGEGGDSLLTRVLRDRGALVDHLEVYQRSCPIIDNQFIWQPKPANVIICTSCEGLINLYRMTSHHDRQILLNTQLIGISLRQAYLARKLGFVVPMKLARSAVDDDMIQAIFA